MENEVDLSSTNPLDLTPKGSLAIENLDTISPIAPQKRVELAQNNPIYPGQGQGIMGTNRMLVSPKPDENPLDNEERLLTERRNRLQGAASRPWTQFLFHDEAQEYEKEAAKLSGEIQQVQQKRQMQQDVQMAARNRGLTRTLGPNATQETLTEESLREMKEGNYDAFKGLIGAGQGARAQLYMPEFVQSLGKQTEAGQKAVEELNSATNQAEYNSIRNNVLKNAKDSKHEYSASSLGLDENSIPKSKMQWEKDRGAATAKLNQALQTVEQFKQQQASLSQAVPITDEKVAAAVTSNISGSTGEAFPNTQAVTLPGAGGAQGAEFKQPGSKDLANYKKEWDNLSPAEIKTASEQLNSEQFKGVLGKYKTSKDFFLVANDDRMYTYSAGLAAINDKFGAVERNVAEGSRGSGTIGLTKQLENQYGVPEHIANAYVKARSEIKSWIDGGSKGPMPKLSAQSIEGMKYVATATYNQDKNELDRLALPAYTIGYRGGGMDKLGVDKEIQNDPYLKEINERGTEKYRQDVDKYPFIVKGDKRIALRQDAQVPGMIPAGAYAKTLTPAEQRGTGASALPPTPTASGLPSPGGGGGTPFSPVGPLNGPNPSGGPNGGGGGPASGISKDYLIKTAKVESGNEPDPWGAGNNKTSASGAYQFTNATWNANKPEGAPNRAAEATPQQQTEAANKLTNANAKVLARNDIPVNDTTAYIAHNLGASGAVNFMKARDDAKARAVVGETAANNNPLFFKGDPTVGEVKTRYAQAMGQPTAEQIAAYNANKESFATQRAKMAESATRNAANIAPSLGAVAGMPLGPAGTIAGGAAGGAVRQAFNGGPGYVDQMARGALEAIPAAIPGIGPARIAARVAAGGAVPAAEKLYDTGGEDVSGAIESGAVGATGGIIGEGAGIFGHALWSKFGPGPQKELIAAAKTLATGEPKIADATGKMVTNPAYAKAKQDIEAIGKNPDQVAHDTRAAMAGVPKGEALAKRPGAIEAERIGREEYQPIREDIATAGKGMAPKAQPALADGPISTIRTPQNPGGTVPDTKTFRDLAQHYEIEATAPAKSVDERWQRLGNARSELLSKERDALGSTAADSGTVAKAMRDMANSLRVQQEAMAKALLPPDKANALINRLETADVRYRRAMLAGAGEKGDIVKAIAKGGPEGREAQAAFNALAANDPTAKRMVRSLVEMEKSPRDRALMGAAVIGGAQLLHAVPVVGTALASGISVVKAGQMIRDYMVKRGAGAPVTFKTILDRELGHARRAGSVIGSSVGNQMAQ